jgi:hypothetical protein
MGADVDAVLLKAYRAGADQELEACVEWLPSCLTINGESLRDVRRPKPPSLAEEALDAMRSMQIEPCRINGIIVNAELTSKYDTIRRALERLQELEGGND